MLRAVLFCAAALGFFSLVVFAQPLAAQPEKKDEPSKSKAPEKSTEPAKEPPKVTLDEWKLPNDAIIVIVEDLLKAKELIPSQIVMSLKEYLALKEQVKTLERQLKGNRKLPSACKIYGKLKGDFLICRAEYLFSTEQPKTTVPLGLQGGLLMDGEDLDRLAPFLDLDKDDGYTVRIDKEAPRHQVTLNFQVPVKKMAAGGTERSIDLGLPGAAVTILNLELTAGVKELRWNGTSEKAISAGRWQIGLEKTKTLNLVWKEPLPPSGNMPVAKVDGAIKVEVDATHVNVTADLFLEDRGPRTDEWHLYLPPLAKVEAVKAPIAGVVYKLDEKGSQAILRVPVTSDRWQVTISQRVPRPAAGAKISIGPFQVQSSYPQAGGGQAFAGVGQQGTISVKMPAELSLGQRLVYTRFGEVTQTKNGETDVEFKYVTPAPPDKNLKTPAALKAPLELEWRFEKNQLRTEVVHAMKVKTGNQGFDIDVTTRIQVTALFSTIGTIDLKLPQSRPRGVALLGTVAPNMAFPGSLSWGGVWQTFGTPWTYVNPDELSVTDESGGALKLAPDPTGKTRVLWTRGSTKQLTLEVKSSYRLPPQNRHIRLELPRPLNTQDRRAKLSIQTDDRIELLHGPEGDEEPVPDRHHFDLSWDQSPAVVDLAWRPHRREIVAQSTIDIDIHEHSAQVQQSLRFPRDRSAVGPEAKNSQIFLKTPRGVDKVQLLSGGEIAYHDRAQEKLWVRPSDDAAEMIDLKLQYDLSITKKHLLVTPILAAHGSQEDIKVRVWTPAGLQARLTPDVVQRGMWKERSIELIRDREQFPSLVLASFGSNLPLTLEIDEAASTSLAAILADRALIQVRMGDDGSQQCQAKYLVRKINSPYLDVELPPFRFREPPTFFLGKHPLTQWKPLDANSKVIRVQLHPELATLPAVLEITYTLPAEALERRSIWSTTLYAPIFRSEAVVGQMRWQFSTPAPVIAASFGRNVHTDTQWSVQGWLPTPETVATDGEAWLNGREPSQPGPAVTYAFALVSLQPETVYHLPRQWWLLICSGVFLILTLGVYFSPLPRWSLWLVLAALSVGLATFAILCPAAWPAVAFGLEPGLLLFVGFASVHWLLQERYRRQLVFLPGFNRAKTGSTITRSNASKRPREASTVDAPPGAMEGTASKGSVPPLGT